MCEPNTHDYIYRIWEVIAAAAAELPTRILLVDRVQANLVTSIRRVRVPLNVSRSENIQISLDIAKSGRPYLQEATVECESVSAPSSSFHLYHLFILILLAKKNTEKVSLLSSRSLSSALSRTHEKEFTIYQFLISVYSFRDDFHLDFSVKYFLGVRLNGHNLYFDDDGRHICREYFITYFKTLIFIFKSVRSAKVKKRKNPLTRYNSVSRFFCDACDLVVAACRRRRYYKRNKSGRKRRSTFHLTFSFGFQYWIENNKWLKIGGASVLVRFLYLSL